jgi:hypothetical protein
MAGLQAKMRVNADMDRAKALGVNSTPTLYINGVSVQFEDMTVSGLKALVDAEIQKAAPQKEAPAKVETAPAANGNK